MLHLINADMIQANILILLIVCANLTESKQTLDAEKLRYHAIGEQDIRINSDSNQKKIYAMKNESIHFKTNYQGKKAYTYGYI